MTKEVTNYNLNISKQILDDMGLTVASEEKNYTADSLDELNNMLKLAGMPTLSSNDAKNNIQDVQNVQDLSYTDSYVDAPVVDQPTPQEVENELEYMKQLSGMTPGIPFDNTSTEPEVNFDFELDHSNSEQNSVCDHESCDSNDCGCDCHDEKHEDVHSCTEIEHAFCNDPNCGCACHSSEEERLPVNPYLEPQDLTLDGYNQIGDIGLWKAQNYEKMLQTPAAQWPQFLEELNEYLIQNGYTVEKASEELLDMMNLDVNETFDYGLRDINDEQSIRTIKGFNNNKSNWNRTDQLYVQARYGDNPMNPKGLHEGKKDLESLYKEFLNENDEGK